MFRFDLVRKMLDHIFISSICYTFVLGDSNSITQFNLEECKLIQAVCNSNNVTFSDSYYS